MGRSELERFEECRDELRQLLREGNGMIGDMRKALKEAREEYAKPFGDLEALVSVFVGDMERKVEAFDGMVGAKGKAIEQDAYQLGLEMAEVLCKIHALLYETKQDVARHLSALAKVVTAAEAGLEQTKTKGEGE